MNQKIINLCKEHSQKRCLIKNCKGGRAYMEAFLVNKTLSCVLWERDKSLQR